MSAFRDKADMTFCAACLLLTKADMELAAVSKADIPNAARNQVIKSGGRRSGMEAAPKAAS